MRIIFWGTPSYSIGSLKKIIEHGYEIVAVVTQPDRRRGRGKTTSPCPVKEYATNCGIPVFSPENLKVDKEIKNEILRIPADIYIVVAFGQILPKDVLSQPKLGCWNSHASLLPKWRGAAPIQWSILKGETKTGVGIMHMEEGLDTGPIILESAVKIEINDNLTSLSEKLSSISGELLVEAIDNLKNTLSLSQEERLRYLGAKNQEDISINSTYARQIHKDDFLVNWDSDTNVIHNQIRGLYPNAYTFYKGKRLKVHKARPIANQYFLNDQIKFHALSQFLTSQLSKNGQVISADNKFGFIVKTKDIPLLIESGQVEGRKISSGDILSAQLGIKESSLLGS